MQNMETRYTQNNRMIFGSVKSRKNAEAVDSGALGCVAAHHILPWLSGVAIECDGVTNYA